MNTLINFDNFVNELKKENGRLYKLSVLERYKDDEDIRYCLNFLFNPYITTGISSGKLNKEFTHYVAHLEFEHLKDLLEHIKVHNTGRDEDIASVRHWLDNLPCCEETFKGLITKSLILGIDVKTINKAIPNLIPEFSVQLAERYFDHPEKIEGKEFALTTKIDGGRIIAIKENGNINFYTRQGQLYEGLVDLEEEMKHFPDNICLDGEITLLDKGRLTSKDQYKQTMKITRADGEKHGVKMLVFDYLTAEEFRNQHCETPYSERRKKITELQLAYPTKYFDYLPILYQGRDTNKIIEWLDYNINKGEEGIMINVVDAPYEFKRNWNLVKVKKMQDMDLEVIGFEEGTGKNAGSLGALLVDYDGFTVKVGSGYSDELRAEIWANKDEWLGRTVVVQYFETSTNQQGGKSLRFPVYIDYRTDK